MRRRALFLLLLLAAWLPAAAALDAGRRMYAPAGADSLAIDPAGAERLVVETTLALASDRPRLGLSASTARLRLDNGLMAAITSGNDNFGYDDNVPYTHVELWLADSLLLASDMPGEVFRQGSGARNTLGFDLRPLGSGKSAVTLYGGGDGLRPLWEGELPAALPRLAVAGEGADCTIDCLMSELWRPEGLAAVRFEADALGQAEVWTMFDHTLQPDTARPGGDYRLALIDDPDPAGPQGTKLLVYLDGAQVDAARWQAGMAKARLTPTAFADHYSLEWLEASGRPAGPGCHAFFSAGGSLLTLEFPALGATLRLQRVSPQPDAPAQPRLPDAER